VNCLTLVRDKNFFHEVNVVAAEFIRRLNHIFWNFILERKLKQSVFHGIDLVDDVLLFDGDQPVLGVRLNHSPDLDLFLV
jgi:hypothetical protein